MAGVLIGQYAKAALGSKPAKIVTLDLFPGTRSARSAKRLPEGFGLAAPDARATNSARTLPSSPHG